MEPYIERKQCAGFLKFLLVLAVVAWLVPALWGMVLAFVYVMVVVGIPVAIAGWLVEKWLEVNRNTTETEDQQSDSEHTPWWLDDRRERFRRN